MRGPARWKVGAAEMWFLVLGAIAATPGTAAFEANVGQAPTTVSHLVRGDHEVAFVTNDGFVLAVPTAEDEVINVRARWRGAAKRTPRGVDRLSGNFYYFLGTPEGRRASRYRRLVAADLYPGVELGYELEDTLRFGFVVAPGADVKRIRLGFDTDVELRVAARTVEVDVIDPRSSRVLMTMRLSGLRAWQETSSGRVDVDVRFVPLGDAVGFGLGPHDPTRAVHIDPDITYASYISGASTDDARDVAVDAAGRVYVTGFSINPGTLFPTTAGALQPMPPGGGDAFVVKVDPTQSGASSLVYGSFIGGGFNDVSNGIGVDANGRAAIGGTTSFLGTNTFPTTTNAYSQAPQSSFVTMLNAAGSQLVYSTFFGSTSTGVSAVTVDPTGAVIAVGGTGSGIPEVNAMTVTTAPSAFVLKFDVGLSQAASVVYGTRFDALNALDLDVDASGIYMFGRTGLGLATTPGAPQAAFGGGADYFVTKLDPTQVGNAAIRYTTYLGGSDNEGGVVFYGGIAVDGAGAAYATGLTGANFPTTPGTLAATPPGGGEGFVTKIDPTGTSFVYSTYLGATGNDGGYDVAVDSMGRAYVVGFGTGLPVIGCGPATPGGGFAMQLDAQGTSLQQASFLSPGANLRPLAVALGPTGLAYAVGTIGAPSQLPTPGAFQTVQAGGDAFVAELAPSGACADLDVSLTATPNPLSGASSGQVQATLQNLGPNDAAQVDLSIFVPPSFDVLGVSPSVCTGGPSYTCAIGPLSSGGSITVTFDVEARAAGTFTATAAVSAAIQDPDASNDAAQVSIVVSTPNTPCGFETLYGSCAGDTLSFCEDRGLPAERLTQVDCATDAFPTGVPGECTLINTSYGYDCAVSPGGVCAFVDAQDRALFALCAGEAAGCRIDPAAGTAECEVGLPACQSDQFDVQCAGDLLIQECQVDQPVVLDCAAIGGQCANARCEGLPVDAPCDDDRLHCAPGLICDEVSERCEDPSLRCDPTAFRSSCAGDTLTACDRTRSRVVSVDCNEAFDPTDGTTCGAPFTCQGRACGDVNVTCVGGGEGARCDLAREIYCGAGFGCVLERGADGSIAGVCRNTTMCPASTPDPSCVGDIAPVCLRGDGIVAVEAQGVDCTSFGSTCDLDGATSVCVGGPGASCQVVPRGGSLLRCRAGLTCEDTDDDGFGTCSSAPDAPDAGPSADASTPPGRDAGSTVGADGGITRPVDDTGEGCGCHATPTRRNPAALAWTVPLLVLAGIRRRSARTSTRPTARHERYRR